MMILTKQWIYGYNHGGHYVYNLRVPEGVPELRCDSSSGTKGQMLDLAKRLGAKYGWELEVRV